MSTASPPRRWGSAWRVSQWTPTQGRWAVAALLAGATLLLYTRTAGYPFIYFDDTGYVTENAQVRSGLSWSGLVWAFTTLQVSNWHPLTWLSHMLDVQLFGLHAGAHHFVSVLVHAANAALLFLVLARMTGAPGRSAFVAALFAVHPLHVESVAWISERKDVLSTLFGLLALWAYARYSERGGVGRYLLVALSFALSLLSKPMWVTLPCLLVLLDYWPLQRVEGSPLPVDPGTPVLPRWPLGRLLLEKAPLLALSAASSAVTVVAQNHGGSLAGLDLPIGPRLANAAVAYIRYLEKTCWPFPLAVFYPYPPEGTLPVWQAVGAGALLVAVTALVLRYARRLPWLSVGWFWFLGMLVPVIGLVQVGMQSMADRYSYVPIIGLFIAAAWGAHRIAGTWRAGLPLGAIAASALFVLSALTWHQLTYWSSHESLFRHALAVTPDNAAVHGVLSEGLRHEGKRDEALAHARLAVQLDPRDVRNWNNLGASELDLGHLTEALEPLQQAVHIDPRHAPAWINLGEVELQLAHLDEAAAALREAVRLKPDESRAWNKLGMVEARQGQVLQAMDDYREAVRLGPDNVSAWNNLAILYQGMGRVSEAGDAFRATTRLEPGNAVTWRNLGVHLVKSGRPADAVQAFREALRLKPSDADVMNRLGLAEAALGRRSEALDLAAKLEGVDPVRGAELRRAVTAGP